MWPWTVLVVVEVLVAVGGRRRSYVSLRPSTTLQPLFKLQCAKRFFFSGPGWSPTRPVVCKTTQTTFRKRLTRRKRRWWQRATCSFQHRSQFTGNFDGFTGHVQVNTWLHFHCVTEQTTLVWSDKKNDKATRNGLTWGSEKINWLRLTFWWLSQVPNYVFPYWFES